MISRVTRAPVQFVYVACILALALFAPPLHAQSSTTSPAPTESTSESEQDYLDQSINLETGENTGALNRVSESGGEASVDTSNSSVTWYITKTLAVLVVLCLGVWGLVKFLKKSGFGGASNKFMSIHSTLAVGQNQYLQIVQIGKQFFMIGVTDRNVNMLGEITDSETITDLQLNSNEDEEQNQSGMKNFGDLLNQFTGTSQHEFGEQESDSQNEAQSQLSDLRNKIENMRESGGQA